MTTTLDDEPTVAEVLAMLDDDVVRLLDSTAGALVTRRDLTDGDREDEREALEISSGLLMQAWANVKRAAEIVRADVRDAGRPSPARLQVVHHGSLWYVRDSTGVWLGFDRTQAGAMDMAHDIVRRRSA